MTDFISREKPAGSAKHSGTDAAGRPCGANLCDSGGEVIDGVDFIRCISVGLDMG